MKALLLSGGMDSSAMAFLIKPDIGITLSYGQQCATAEIQAARIICERLSIQHEVLSVPLKKLGSGDLAGKPAAAVAPATDWWPYRNQALVTLAAMHLLPQGVKELFIACVRQDSNHRDGTGKFIDLLDRLISFQEGGLRIKAPAIELSTSELVVESKIPIPLLAWTHSCHKSDIACGNCRGCNKHRQVVHELGYAENS